MATWVHRRRSNANLQTPTPTARRTLPPPQPVGATLGGITPRWRVIAFGAVVAVLAVLTFLATRPASGAPSRPLSLSAAALLGVVEGLTEWLPISSTGHLAVIQNLLGITGDAADSYAIAIQSGAILAVVSLYHRRFVAMAHGLFGTDVEGRRLLLAIAVAALPAAIAGLAFRTFIKDNLFAPWPIVTAWLAGGVVILVVARRRHKVDARAGATVAALRCRGALIIGVAQMLALWPGVSRSLVTILAGMAIGLAVPAAVEFSFLLGFVTLGGATVIESWSSGSELVAAYGIMSPVVGLAFAFVSAILAMRWMVGYLNSHGLGVFGWYRIGVAAAAAGLLVVTRVA